MSESPNPDDQPKDPTGMEIPKIFRLIYFCHLIASPIGAIKSNLGFPNDSGALADIEICRTDILSRLQFIEEQFGADPEYLSARADVQKFKEFVVRKDWKGACDFYDLKFYPVTQAQHADIMRLTKAPE